MFVTAIIAAGGRGERFGGTVPKQLTLVGGRAVLERSVAAFIEHPAVNEVIVTLPRELVAAPPAYMLGRGKPLRIVEGGARRQDSVANGFRAAAPNADVIVIHDAARPFASADLITRTIAAAAEKGAALAAVRARDTVKRGVNGIVAETISRESVYLAQTPQAFRASVLADALAVRGDATDEAALAERAGHPVVLVEGEETNIKITTPADVVIAEAIARAHGTSKPARTGRTGTGYDSHRFVEGRPLILGGVTIPFDRGLAGHSDADALCHAITDAILGAAAAGDIGRHFPDTDPKWEGASSIALLKQAVAVVRAQGYEIGNVDATVIAERPKLAPYIDAIRASLATAIGIDVDRVSVKGKTSEGMDAAGQGVGIVVHAIAQIRHF
jgi:2-C-methyl-D-erythritol 4-phosphate cytidylyltransferase/2-C-methyl-D-erythritol 2,4-cyclodiphosphate synthase